jgi:hypothetical protein
MASARCPHCGEIIDTFPDPGDGALQEYIEDCSVCCKPILFRATLDETGDDYVVEATSEV